MLYRSVDVDARTQPASTPASKLDPRTSKHRLLECSRCHEPVASSGWSGPVVLRCGHCAREDERELVLERDSAVASDVASDKPATKLTIDLEQNPQGYDVLTLDVEMWRAALRRWPSRDEDDAAFEWVRVWMAAWLSLKQYVAGDSLRARVTLETTLEATSIPAYRALLLARLAQHAAGQKAVVLAKKWLRACPSAPLVEVESEVRVARAMIALAKDDVRTALDLTGDMQAGAGCSTSSVGLSIAVNIVAHERQGNHAAADEIIADCARKAALPYVALLTAMYGMDSTGIVRFRRAARRRAVAWTAAPASSITLAAGALLDAGLPSTAAAAVVTGVAAAALRWRLFSWVPPARYERVLGYVTTFGIPALCVVASVFWLARVGASRSVALADAPAPATSASAAPSATGSAAEPVSGEESELPPGTFELKVDPNGER